MRHVVIRADGGPDIGFGHLVRTGALAEELLDRGHRVTYLSSTVDPVEAVCPPEVEVVKLQSRTDVGTVCELLTNGIDTVVIDSYVADAAYQQAIREQARAVVITDDTRHAIAADVAVNGNLYAPELDYEVQGEPPVWCLGPDFILIRERILRLAKQEPPWRESAERAIVTLGGSDKGALTPTVVQAFEGLDLMLDVIVGPGFSAKQAEAVRDTAEAVSIETVVSRDPDDLPKRMFEADLAVSTASSTTYELLALGTPIVSIPVVENQYPIARSLEEYDAATVLERGASTDSFARAIEEYHANPSLRQERRRRGRNLVDGEGVQRVADAVCPDDQ